MRRNNWIWRHPFIYGLIGACISIIAFGLVVSELKNWIFIFLIAEGLIIFFDGYRRDNYKWKCPTCGYTSFVRYKYCPKCGDKMSAYPKTSKKCPKCGYHLEGWEDYCPNCGNKLMWG